MGRRDRPIGRWGTVRGRAAAVLLAERLHHALLPAGGFFLAYLTAAIYGHGAPALFALCLSLAVLSFAARVAVMAWPTPAEIDRRIEAASGLAHRPFAILRDQPESADPLTLAIWRAHQARAEIALAGARAGWPAAGGANADPYALRGLLLLLLLAGIFAAGPAAPSRLAGAFTLPSWTMPAPRLDVWITAPDYANTPPLLAIAGGQYATLAGSRLSVLVNGPRQSPGISLPGTRLAVSRLAATSFRADATLTTSGRLTIGPWWHRLGVWRIDVTAPAAPRLRLRGLALGPDGRLRLLWTATDPYGLTDFSLRLAPLNAPAALPLIFSLPTGTGDGEATLDLTDDPLAGLPTQPILTARNRAGLATTLVSGLVFTPPVPALADATAAALFIERRGLARDPGDRSGIGGALQTISMAPPSAIADSVDVQLAALAGSLQDGGTSANSGVERLGLLIHEITNGPDEAAAALAQANQALLNTLRQGLTGAPATPAALQKLMADIASALARRFAATPPAAGTAGQPMDLGQLGQLARKIAADEAAGHTAAAAQEMAALQNMLHQLQSAQPMTAAEAARAKAAATAAQALAGITAAEAKLRDATARGTGTPSQQAAIAGKLAAAGAAAGQAGVKLPGLDPAARAMANAEASLNTGAQDTAESAETAAIQALQKAAAALAATSPPILSITGSPAGGAQGATGVNDDASGFHFPAPNPADAIEQQILHEDDAPDLPPATHAYLRRLLNPESN